VLHFIVEFTLATFDDGASSGKEARRKAPTAQHTTKQAVKLDPALEALFAEGDAMAAAGVDFSAWAAHSRDVWR
jgi:hypothetical protein